MNHMIAVAVRSKDCAAAMSAGAKFLWGMVQDDYFAVETFGKAHLELMAKDLVSGYDTTANFIDLPWGFYERNKDKLPYLVVVDDRWTCHVTCAFARGVDWYKEIAQMIAEGK